MGAVISLLMNLGRLGHASFPRGKAQLLRNKTHLTGLHLMQMRDEMSNRVRVTARL